LVSPRTGSSANCEADPVGALLERIAACRACLDAKPCLPQNPRPVLRASSTARLLVASQAPGVRAHNSGMSFDDPSGDRLRSWMGVDRDTFYDTRRIAVVPMGFCFPGHDARKGDLPPRRECRAIWHDELFAGMPQIETVLAIGAYAQDYHFARLGAPRDRSASLTDVVRDWRRLFAFSPRVIPLPHPSWRNSGWLKKNPWFEIELLPVLRAEVLRLV
jgi:uracil-DNA glycosylase